MPSPPPLTRHEQRRRLAYSMRRCRLKLIELSAHMNVDSTQRLRDAYKRAVDEYLALHKRWLRCRNTTTRVF